mgnify:CR=1 FL=1
MTDIQNDRALRDKKKKMQRRVDQMMAAMISADRYNICNENSMNGYIETVINLIKIIDREIDERIKE